MPCRNVHTLSRWAYLLDPSGAAAGNTFSFQSGFDRAEQPAAGPQTTVLQPFTADIQVVLSPIPARGEENAL